MTFNEKGFPEYRNEHLYGGKNGPPAEVLIEFECKRDLDFRHADEIAGFGSQRPADYAWHHSHVFKKEDNKVMIQMQLVHTDIHRWTQHTGGIAIGKEILGAGYCR